MAWTAVLLIPVALLLIMDVDLGYWIYYLKLRGHFFAATIGVGIYSDVDMIGSLCRLMARGAIISMIMVLLLLPSLYLLFDRVIMKTRWGSPSEQKQKRAARKAAAASANL